MKLTKQSNMYVVCVHTHLDKYSKRKNLIQGNKFIESAFLFLWAFKEKGDSRVVRKDTRS